MSNVGPIRQQHDGVLLAVKLQPRASRNEIGEVADNELKIKVTAPPVDSAANQALIKLLSSELNHPKNSIQLTRGQTSRHKTILIQGLTRSEILSRLKIAPET